MLMQSKICVWFRSSRRRHRSPLSHYHDYRSRDRHMEPYDDRSSANSRVRHNQFNVSMLSMYQSVECVIQRNGKFDEDIWPE